MIVFVGFIVTVLATARLTRVLIFDRVGNRIRAFFTRDKKPDSAVVYLFECFWCMGFWVAAAVTAASYAATILIFDVSPYVAFTYPMSVLAVNYAASYIMGKED